MTHGSREAAVFLVFYSNEALFVSRRAITPFRRPSSPLGLPPLCPAEKFVARSAHLRAPPRNSFNGPSLAGSRRVPWSFSIVLCHPLRTSLLVR